MRVMITGGTGFIGMHTARALMAAGHKVTLLIRSEEKLRSLYPKPVPDFCIGDVTDPESVRKAMQGCDAVVHTAAMVSIDKKDAQRVYDTNVGGTELVMATALDVGVKKIIHVSSVTALYNPQARFLNEYSPPGTASNAYGRSKVECEYRVRELQAAGAPIHITYPGSVIGPDDPALTEPHQGLKTYLTPVVPVLPSGNQWVDVRDIAIAHRELLLRDLPPGRYPLGGHFITWGHLVDLLNALTGRRIRKIPIPGGVMRGVGKLVDFYNSNASTPLELPLTYEAMVYATNWVKLEDSKAAADLDLTPRPLQVSLTDAIRSLVAQGHISAADVGVMLD